MPKECQNCRWDVVIYRLNDREITTIAGRDLPETGSFHTVDKRLDTVSERLNDRFNVAKVPTGKFNQGDTLPEEYAC